MFRGIGVFALSLWTVLLGLSAAAEPRDNPLERARHHMELGQEAFLAGRFETAADEFMNAWTASPFSAFLYNAALANEKGGRADEAVELYRRYLEAEPGAPDAAEVEAKIRALSAPPPVPQTAAAPPPEPSVRITEVEMKSLISVRTNPRNATVRIIDTSGFEVGRSTGDTAITVLRGQYTVEASHPDYRTVHTRIDVTPGQVYIIVVEMSQGEFLGFVHVVTNVPGAAIYVDDRSQGQVGTTPWGNVLPTGKHRIFVEKPGYEPAEREVEIRAGDKLEMTVSLERLPFGNLLVKTNVPSAQATLDGQPSGEPPVEIKASPGRHQLVVSAEGMKDWASEVTVERGRTTKVLVRLNPEPSRTSAWVSLGFAVALFAGGGVAGFMALDINDELEADRNNGRLADDDPRIMEGFLWALGADIAFGLGTVVGALCIYYFLRDPLPPSEGKVAEPVDFEANPKDAPAARKDDGGTKDAKTESPSTAGASRARRPSLAITPLVQSDGAGFALAVAF